MCPQNVSAKVTKARRAFSWAWRAQPVLQELEKAREAGYFFSYKYLTNLVRMSLCKAIEYLCLLRILVLQNSMCISSEDFIYKHLFGYFLTVSLKCILLMRCDMQLSEGVKI